MGCGTSKVVEEVKTDGGASIDSTATKSKSSIVSGKPDRMSMMSQETVRPGQVNNDARRLAIPLEQQSIEEEFGESTFDIDALQEYKPSTPEEEEEYQTVFTAMKEHYLFNDLGEESLNKVLGSMDKVEVNAGKTVIEQGKITAE